MLNKDEVQQLILGGKLSLRGFFSVHKKRVACEPLKYVEIQLHCKRCRLLMNKDLKVEVLVLENIVA
jgi:hypothetical protein